VNFKPQLKISQSKSCLPLTRDNGNGQNGNSFMEPNEIIDILPLVKNYWGPTADVRGG
jgi:hypothetical protein